ncbi:hypothetical protein AVEN_247334-1 [Araneus ventricosus]|uniref:Uncharacterized protein n=1 Tax=Araneus ventricosus TaxID=182803 RepID=A0A4Y2QEV9_ARAVE|nr:hypothetical protein AVEN_247334-1 [Araneus ventricosus]
MDLDWCLKASLEEIHTHESCREVNNHRRVEVVEISSSTACSKNLDIIFWDLGGQWKCLKSEEVPKPFAATRRVEIALSCWNCPNPSECTMT